MEDDGDNWLTIPFGRCPPNAQDADVRRSDDPGHFCCGFIYYTALEAYWARNSDGPRPALFLHVPAGETPAQIAEGVAAAAGLIRAMVASREDSTKA